MAELDDLRAAYRAGSHPSGEHLSEATWEQLACGELEGDARRIAHEHILTCRECSAIARAVLTIQAEAPTFDPAAPRPGLPSQRSPVTWLRRAWVPALLTAAAALVLFAVVRPQSGSVPTVGQPLGSAPILRSANSASPPVPIAPTGTVSVATPTFEWQPVEGASSYVVEVLDATGEPLWTSAEVAVTELPWPGTIDPGQYFWRVTAWRDNGGPPITSQLTDFEVETPVTTSHR